MPLNDHLRTLRESRDRSRRWVERQSRRLHPDDRSRQISHSYLRQLEEGKRINPSPHKLRTLAQIYGADPHDLMVAAGYVETETERGAGPAPDLSVAGDRETGEMELARRLVHKLEAEGLRSGYFLNSLLKLGPESLQIVSRLITTLSVQEEQLRTRGVGTGSPDGDPGGWP